MTRKITSRQRKAIAALLTGSTVTQAAAIAGVRRETASRWFRQDAFRLAIAELERVAVDALSRRLVLLADQAADTLGDAMTDGESDNVKVRAAGLVLANLRWIRELATLEDRIVALEQRSA